MVSILTLKIRVSFVPRVSSALANLAKYYKNDQVLLSILSNLFDNTMKMQRLCHQTKTVIADDFAYLWTITIKRWKNVREKISKQT